MRRPLRIPAFGASVTVDDYGKFLDMILHGGVSNGTRVLSSDAVAQMISDQVSHYDTSHDFSVGITGIPRYGLGCWPDVQDPSHRTAVVSGNGGKGFYPWVDSHDRDVGHRRRAGRTRRAGGSPGVARVEVEARTAVAR